MNNAVLKTIKGLKQFTIEDVELITGCDEAEIIEVINRLNIIEADGIYILNKEKKNKPKRKAKTGKNILFKNFSQKYLNQLKCSDSTKNSYIAYLRLHLNPVFGSKRIIDIAANDISCFQKAKQRQGQSNKSINNYVTLLYGIFKYALKEELVIKNPCWIVKRLEAKKKIRQISRETLEPFFKISKERDLGFYIMICIAYETGIPRDEIINLKWSEVNESLKHIKGTEINEDLFKELKIWKLTALKNEYNLVFPNTVGKKWNPENIMNRRFKPLAKKAGMVDLRFVDLTNQRKLLLR